MSANQDAEIRDKDSSDNACSEANRASVAGSGKRSAWQENENENENDNEKVSVIVRSRSAELAAGPWARCLRHAVCVAIVWLVCFVTVSLLELIVSGGESVRVMRTAAMLLMPVGLIWSLGISLLLVSGFQWLRRDGSTPWHPLARVSLGFVALCVTLITLTCCTWIFAPLREWMHAGYGTNSPRFSIGKPTRTSSLATDTHASNDVLPIGHQPDFDLVVVLGGGAYRNTIGEPIITGSGQRVVLAAQLYHNNRVARIICTGSSGQSLDQSSDSTDPAIVGRDLLASLNVDPADVVLLPGINTAAELLSLRNWIDRPISENANEQQSVTSALGPTASTFAGSGSGNDANESAPRIGLITDALHMPRAQMLAARCGLQLHHLPVGVAGQAGVSASVAQCLPSAWGGYEFSKLMREVLSRLKDEMAGIAGR